MKTPPSNPLKLLISRPRFLCGGKQGNNARQPPECRATSARSLPAVAISHESAADAADHSADAEDAHGYRVDERDVIVGDLLTVADLVGCADELLDDLQVDRRRR